MKTSQIRNLTEEELLQKVSSSKEELYKLNYQRRTGRVEKPHRFWQLRKDIARIKTVLKEKKKPKEDKLNE